MTTRTIKSHDLKSGFSLLEVVMAMAILVTGMLALTSRMARVHTLDQSDTARAAAGDRLRATAEQLISFSEEAVAQDPETWALTITSSFESGGTPGNSFHVGSLGPGASEATGSIQVIRDETLTDAEVGISLGLPRDLNGDGDADDMNVSSTASLLPVIIRINWTSRSGDREAVHGLYLLGI